jgi:outer membrane protein insertion porin family
MSVHGEGGYIHPLQDAEEEGQDAIRISDRFFGPTMRGFDIRGIGPRIVRLPYLNETEVDEDADYIFSDALGGRAYYMGRIEIEFPTNSTLKNLGLRPSAFVDIGSVWKLTKPDLLNEPGSCSQPDNADADSSVQVETLEPGQVCSDFNNADGAFTYIPNSGAREFFLGNSVKPRLSVGVGVNWVSPFGPLRIDIAKALLKQEGDETKLFSFNVGTQF